MMNTPPNVVMGYGGATTPTSQDRTKDARHSPAPTHSPAQQVTIINKLQSSTVIK